MARHLRPHLSHPALRTSVTCNGTGDGVNVGWKEALATFTLARLWREADRRGYEEHPERPDPFWGEAEAWSDG